MKDLQKQITDWHLKEFGEGGKKSTIALKTLDKIEEEYQEFLGTLQGTLEEAEEIADIIIVLLAYAGRMDYDMDAEVRRKFEIVKNRDQRQRDEDRGLI